MINYKSGKSNNGFTASLLFGGPQSKPKPQAVCYGESAEQGVALYKCRARSRASLSLSEVQQRSGHKNNIFLYINNFLFN